MKRAFLIVLGVALLLPVGSQAQSAGTQWTCSLDNQADSVTLCIVAPEPGMRRYITDVIAQSTTATAGSFQLQYGNSTATGGAANCGVGTGGTTMMPPGLDAAALGRFEAAGNAAPPTEITLPLIVPSGQDLCALGNPDNPVTIQLIGYVAP